MNRGASKRQFPVRSKRNVRLCLLMLMPAVLLPSWGCRTNAQLATLQPGGPQDKATAGKLFNELCAKCHGSDGRARTFHGRLVQAQNFTDAKWQASTKDEELINAIKTGPKAMPAFETKLSQAQIEVLAAYVRTFKEE